MFKLFGIIGTQLEQIEIRAWPHRGQWWAVGVHERLKSLVMGPSLLDNCYLENEFHKKIGIPPTRNFPD